MSLACECDLGDSDDWYYYPPHDETVMPALKRRKRCCSCKRLIDAGAVCVRFERERQASEMESWITGHDTVALAPRWMCEECGDMYWSLSELGFCVTLGNESMRELCREYHDIYQQPRAA